MRGRGAFLPLVLALAWVFLFVPSAQATPVTVGELFAPNAACLPFTYLQTGVSSGNSYTVPVSGVVTSWSFDFAATTLPGLKLKVASPADGGGYTIVGEAPASAETPGTVNTYPASIPVQAGDVIGIYDPVSNGICVSTSGTTSADTLRYQNFDVAVGSTMIYTPGSGGRMPLSVTVAPTPGVSSLTPSSGPPGTGTRVTITGHDFTGATAVSFGGTPAERFTVNSDTSITAVSPIDIAGSVDVIVTTPGGQSAATAGDQFTYFVPSQGGTSVPPSGGSSVPQPRVTSVAPSKGPRTGGTTVTIRGHDFTGATAVKFGGAPATRFTMKSDTRITAVAPARSVGKVDVRVTTAGGRSPTTAADRFAFVQVCVVPTLKGNTLRNARKALKKAHCGLGNVNGPSTGSVKHQSRHGGKILPVGTTVNLKLS